VSETQTGLLEMQTASDPKSKEERFEVPIAFLKYNL
jgi:hypothetical protein